VAVIEVWKTAENSAPLMDGSRTPHSISQTEFQRAASLRRMMRRYAVNDGVPSSWTTRIM
jgi:hypothetical protein